MVDKPNQYKQALSAVGSAFGSHEEPFETSGYATLGEGFATSISGSAWTSSQADTYATDVAGIVDSVHALWKSAKEHVAQDGAAESDMVDDEGEESWKARFLDSAAGAPEAGVLP